MLAEPTGVESDEQAEASSSPGEVADERDAVAGFRDGSEEEFEAAPRRASSVSFGPTSFRDPSPPPAGGKARGPRKSLMLAQLAGVGSELKQKRRGSRLSGARMSLPASMGSLDCSLLSAARARALAVGADLSPEALAYEVIKKNQRRRREMGAVSLPTEKVTKLSETNLRELCRSLAWLISASLSPEQDVLWNLFQTVDANLDGVLDEKEAVGFFRGMDNESGDAEVAGFFEQADRAMAGRLSFVDVMDWYWFHQRTHVMKESLRTFVAERQTWETLHWVSFNLFRELPSEDVIQRAPKERLQASAVRLGQTLGECREWMAEQSTLLLAEAAGGDHIAMFVGVYDLIARALPHSLQRVLHAFAGQDVDFRGHLKRQEVVAAFREATEGVDDAEESLEGESRLEAWLDDDELKRVTFVQFLEWWERNYELQDGLLALAATVAATAMSRPRVLVRIEVQPSKVVQSAIHHYLKVFFEVVAYLARRDWLQSARSRSSGSCWCCSERPRASPLPSVSFE
mmetsp:Transcript_89021/g.238355  ORF Transcript_89021/g.238355 Transcript_89021/m.238355 type:complete len:516 (-) Transcript_89021:243-1790(-)